MRRLQALRRQFAGHGIHGAGFGHGVQIVFRRGHGGKCTHYRAQQAAGSGYFGEQRCAVIQLGSAAAVGNVVGFAADGGNAAVLLRNALGDAVQIGRAAARVHTFSLPFHPGNVCHFARITAHGSKSDFCQQLRRGFAPQPGKTSAHRIKHHRHARAVGRFARHQHGFHLLLIQRADVQYYCRANRCQFRHFVHAVGHNRRRADGEQTVGREIGRHDIGDVVHQRVAGTDLIQIFDFHITLFLVIGGTGKKNARYWIGREVVLYQENMADSSAVLSGSLNCTV